MHQALLLGLLTLFASAIGTATGFGTSTVMVPVMVLFVPLPVALLFVGIVHLAGDLWKILLFRRGADWKLILGFGITGIAAGYLGAALSFSAAALPLERILGGFLILYVIFLFFHRRWKLPKTTATAASGGLLSGLFAGFFGVGGAVRGAFLTAFDLPPEVYIFTSGMIALFIDITRIGRYLQGGTRLGPDLLTALLISIPVSLLGAYLAKRLLDRIPKRHFRIFVAIFLALVGARLLIWG
ncbi:MAG: sulfite exporter TauE/SafE family protein [Candidatus Erginobacter occultus]|nr:sulfite exporter TauE/SafE family protein [Candidatus Erginobacter occultus]